MTEETKRNPGELEPSIVFPVNDLVHVGPGAVVSRTLAKTEGGTLTAFAFDEGQGISEHSAPFDAVVQVVSGRLTLTIGGEPVEVAAGEILTMPADIPHALHAPEPSVMLLTMLRGARK